MTLLAQKLSHPLDRAPCMGMTLRRADVLNKESQDIARAMEALMKAVKK